jgi:hypothetical protein
MPNIKTDKSIKNMHNKALESGLNLEWNTIK